ncbi:hypothetical protein [Xanthomonas sp. GPE 39]|uniref:hypothetical protein n=1 Tax=Xanthomonas sp. GPE 39 TaxID=1583099 RepID=UPI001F3FAD00|nr:hypothetical protein [Xanthomonas sp. GPE 39]
MNSSTLRILASLSEIKGEQGALRLFNQVFHSATHQPCNLHAVLFRNVLQVGVLLACQRGCDPYRISAVINHVIVSCGKLLQIAAIMPLAHHRRNEKIEVWLQMAHQGP